LGKWLIGIDIGSVQVGVALADQESGVVVPHGTYLRAQGEAERQILALAEERGIRTIIAGLPLNDDGSLNDQCLKAQNFCRRLQKRAVVDIHFVDEYGTSIDARDLLTESNHGTRLKGLKAAGAVDALAAVAILQRYLNDAAAVK
jgi:putative Holliday junction resolvase